MEEYSKEELKELYSQLPENLKKAVSSFQVGNLVKEICEKNDLENYVEILKKVGYVFLGILSPEEFEREINNKEVYIEINNRVFLDLKNDLDVLYGIDIKKIEPEKNQKSSAAKPKTIKRSGSNDKYLESIE